MIMNHTLGWYWHRLQAMSVPEVLHRTSQYIKHKKERKKVIQNLYAIQDNIDINIKSDNSFNPLVWNSEMQAIYQARFAHNDSGQINVENLMKHQFRLLGFGDFVFPKSIPWHIGIPTMRIWERIYWKDISLQGRDELGDIRVTWELNRHHHFVALAKAYLMSNEDQYRDEIQEQFSDWLSQNPIGTGVNWSSKMELAIRVINWTTCNCLLELAPKESTRDLRLLLQTAILQHCRLIVHDLSLYSSANNHLIVECVSLAMASLLFPDWKESSKWLQHSINLLQTHIPKQVTPDGIHREQSTHYQIFVMEALLLLVWTAHNAKCKLPCEITDGLREMCVYIRTMMNHKGELPTIGDSDDGHILDFGTTHHHTAISILQVCAVLFDETKLKTHDSLEEYAFWLLGPAGIHKFEGMSSPVYEPQSRTFAHGGMTIFRCNNPGMESIMTFDHGDLGYGLLAAHGHADALSITLSICGQRVFVDPGSYIYNIEPEWRSYFRSTMAHNTVCVDNGNQSEILGPFLWGNRAKAKVVAAQFDSLEQVVASHDGFKPTEHIRMVSFHQPDVWFVEDILYVKKEHSLVCSWHIAPGIPVHIEGDTLVLHLQNGCLFGRVIPPEGLSIVLDEGWYSSEFGCKESIPLIRITGSCQAPGCNIVTVWSYNKILTQEQIQSLRSCNRSLSKM